jgi:predicted DNA-binding transcriptional regulator YafY
MASNRTERLLNLVTLLLSGATPTLGQIIRDVPGYSRDYETARGEFKRDRNHLSDEGFPMETVVRSGTAAGTADHFGYRILPDRYRAPDPGLSDAELRAVRRALASIDQSGDVDTFALWKLGGDDALVDTELGELALPPAVGRVADAIALQAALEFRYNGRPRRAEPVGLLLRRANWYLAARVDDGTQLTFRVDRIDGDSIRIVDPGTVSVPEQFDPDRIVPADPWSIASGDPVDVDIEVRGALSRWVESSLRPGSVVGEAEDGTITVRLSVSHYDALRTWLVGLGVDAKVVAPESIVDRFVADLMAVVDPTIDESQAARVVSTKAGPNRTVPAVRSLRRVLSMLTFVGDYGGEAELDELAQRFGVPVATVVADLEFAALCGVPPYGPDDLYDVSVDTDEGVARFRRAGWMQASQAARLTGEEVVAVIAAGRLLAELMPHDERTQLESALAKITSVMGMEGHVRVVLDAPPHLDALRDATQHHQRIRIDHLSFARRTLREGRLVEPLAVTLDDGRWYLRAIDVETGQRRRFRVDRVVGVEATNEQFAPRTKLPASRSWPPKDAPLAVLRAPSSAAWVAESHPSTVTTLDDGSLRIELLVGDWEWLATLCLQIGRGVQLIEPGDRRALPADAARAVLERYGR